MFLKIWATLIVAIFLLGCNSQDKTNQQSGNQTAVSKHGAEELHYKAPDKWIQETPQSPMRKAQYRWPGVEGEGDADMALFHFPGTGGGVEENLQRWYGQFVQPDGTPSEEKAEKSSLQVGGMNVTIVFLTGTYLESTSPMMSGPVEEKPDYAMLAAIVETPNGPWFFKATGPEKTIRYWREDFRKFVKTVDWK